jgi:hypothetical protein
MIWLAGQAQFPELHAAVAGQSFPHWPQFAMSEDGSTQSPKQAI